MKKYDTRQCAMLAVAASGLAWGLLWMPLRALDQSGIVGVWAIVLFYLLPTILLIPVMAARAGAIIHGGWRLHAAGMLAGTALVLYAAALLFTDVVRALLFYYLTPLWSTLLARVFIGEPITGVRWGAIGLAFLGLLTILNVDAGFSGPFQPGDWMGIASGLVWALAAVWMRSDTGGNSVDFTLSYFFWGSIAALALSLSPLEGATPVPDLQAVFGVLPWIIPVALFLIIPPAFAIMWGATVLSPGLLAILFMTEIGAGTITAAIWANEPFGLREMAGIGLIATAGLFEPIMTQGRSEA